MDAAPLNVVVFRAVGQLEATRDAPAAGDAIHPIEELVEVGAALSVVVHLVEELFDDCHLANLHTICTRAMAQSRHSVGRGQSEVRARSE